MSMRRVRSSARRLMAVVGLLLLGAALPSASMLQAQGTAPVKFPHDKHARVFTTCITCHVGVVDSTKTVFPDPSACASCHDGIVQKKIEWAPRVGPRITNLRFTHSKHSQAATAKDANNASLRGTCSACHIEAGAQRMAVQHAIVPQCLACHGVKGTHVDVDRNACATCHLRLTDASLLRREDIAKFPKPSTHTSQAWVHGGHGKMATNGDPTSGSAAIAANCATCHARNLCITCHVNAPELAPIRALKLDDRPPTLNITQPIPESHRTDTWIRVHNESAQKKGATCAVCHTRTSCLTCHVGNPPMAVRAMPPEGEGRAAGAQLIRKPPATHAGQFRDNHGRQANARPNTCETCHQRASCLQCHRPDGTRQAGYHPTNFLTRHPTAAYSRSANCADCHNPSQFCQTCHKQAGLVSAARIGRVGYHDAFRGFSLGHGQAARQSLESCASCHAERDCTACHSAVGGGYRFNPHGPGFNAARMRAKNPSLCIACHGRAKLD